MDVLATMKGFSKADGADIAEMLHNTLQVRLGYCKDKTPYNPKKERTYKLSPEKRAYYRENMRMQRERKRALMG